MNHAKHLSIVNASLKKGGIQDAQLRSSLADLVVGQFEFMMELEVDAAPELVVDFPAAAQPQAEPAKPQVAPDPPAPTDGAESSIIIAKDISLPKGLRIPSNLAHDNAPKIYYSLESLSQLVYQNSPETLSILPSGTERNVELVRNVESLYGINIVKLSYRIADRLSSTPSAPNTRDSPDMPKMAIDLVAFVNFSCYDREQDFPAKMEELIDVAQKIFAPRPAVITSATPRRSDGYLSIRPDDPHADA